jgi:GTPase SAR1 family protein
MVLIGESGVGKTGLAIRLVEDRWEATDSTHGMSVWQLALPQKKITKGIEREVWLWDFAGQPDYRLIHQLYLDETALALIVIDPQRDNPFESLGHWEKALGAAFRHEPAKLLNEILNLSVAKRLIIDIARERRILTTVTAAWIVRQFQLGKARLQGIVIEHPADQRFADPKQEFNSLHGLQ